MIAVRSWLYFDYLMKTLYSMESEPGDDEHVAVLRQLMSETSIQKLKLIKKKKNQDRTTIIFISC